MRRVYLAVNHLMLELAVRSRVVFIVKIERVFVIACLVSRA